MAFPSTIAEIATTAMNRLPDNQETRERSGEAAGRRRLAKVLLARRAAWRRRVVRSMFAGFAALLAAQLALAEFGLL